MEPLVLRAQAGDERAERELYEAHAARVYSTIRRITADDHLADEYSQDAWIRIFKSLSSFRGENPIGHWIHRIAVNSALYGLRKQAARWSREAPLEDDLTVDAIEAAGVWNVDADDVERALGRLPDGMRTVVVLHDIDGYTHVEIAALLAITPGTSKSQLFKGRARLRRLLHPLQNGEN